MLDPLPAPPKVDRFPTLLTLLALLVGLFSYVWAGRHPEFPWDGPILLLVAGGLLGLALRGKDVAQRHPTGEGTRARPGLLLRDWPSLSQVARWRLVAGAASGAITLLVLSHLAAADRSSYAGEFVGWLAAMGLFLLAVAPPVRRPREDWGLWWEVNRWPLLALVTITLTAFALRGWHLATIPATLGGDEGSQGLEALSVLAGDLRNPFATGWLGVPTMSFFFNSLTIGPLGRTIFALRLPWVFVGTATVLITFWLVARLRGLTLGLMTATLLAFYHYHIHFSRLGSNQVADPFFVGLSLLFLYRARDRNSPLDWALVGIVAGAAQYFYAGARLTAVVLGLCLLYFFWNDRGRWKSFKDTLGGALTLGGAFLIASAPMIQYALRFPNEYNARINQVGILQSGWLEREVQARGTSTLAVLWDQFQRAFLAFNVYADRTFWYGLDRPLMDGPWAILFMLGLLYATLRLLPPRPEQRLFPLVVWWWSGMLLGGMLTESPPSAQRLIVLAPPACFFVALVLLRSLQFVQEALGRRDMRLLAPLLAASVLVLSALSVQLYFFDYTPKNVYGNRNAERATALAHLLLRDLEPDETLVMLGPPELYVGFGTLPYLVPRALEGLDVTSPLAAPPTRETLGLPADKQPYFVILPLRLPELQWVQQAFPGGQRVPVNDPKGQPLFWVYDP